AAQKFLGAENISIIGASIGGNIALNYAASTSGVGAVALLSPGEDYRGIQTEQAAREIKAPLFIAASEEDSYAASSSERLYQLAKSGKELKIYKNAGHGVEMLRGTDLQSALLEWLGENFPAVIEENITNATLPASR
ncbi:dienelactone hydrolase family protein, partial [Candidatus Woesearchaeota archaeon]|nr:dienelactone hydrolase family protein [Candidatus Woesearchaeota archaeon]